MRNRVSNSIWGIIFIIIGLGIAGDVMDLWIFSPFFEGWWTLFIIIPCTVSIIREGFRVGSAIGLIIGVMLLASQYVYLDFDIWKLVVPVALVLIGVKIMFQGSFGRNIHNGDRTHMGAQSAGGNSNLKEHVAIFASNNVRVDDQFVGTSLSAVFGGIVLDLRDAIITGDVEISATAIFGGIDIYVPRNVNIKVNNVPIFGGVSNKSGNHAQAGAPVIYLNSTCMFGGIDIK